MSTRVQPVGLLLSSAEGTGLAWGCTELPLSGFCFHFRDEVCGSQVLY